MINYTSSQEVGYSSLTEVDKEWVYYYVLATVSEEGYDFCSREADGGTYFSPNQIRDDLLNKNNGCQYVGKL